MQTTTTAAEAAIKKVPGEVKAVGKLSHEAAMFRSSEMSDAGKSVSELRDLLERQNGILSDAHLLRLLPDGGAKVKRRKERLEEMVRRKTAAAASLSEAENLFSGLSLIDANALEWNRRAGEGVLLLKLDSDDDEEEANTVLSKRPGGTVERSFVPATCASQELSEEQKSSIPLSPRLGEQKTTKSDPMPAENLMPRLKNKPLVTLNLKDSLCLQSQHEKKMKQFWLLNAAARLKDQSAVVMQSPDLQTDDAMSYRDVVGDDDDDDEEDVSSQVKFTVTEYDQDEE